ncbi:SDR family oxidoreductase [Kineosporia babensis]|uniref:SDR family oxidoreductase n=1 Tax=Kineosporia babensis TaxID=499548 RepID=A0A9X1N9S2_9ACTN|nr:SDR family oxidoreductase [Kineosporia babensis]MCD5310163.1 SDR family oxidoreductase [Kineosporia babensis]
MRVFVTGATGFIGSAVVRELQAHGHQVLGLARSEASADKLQSAGAEVHRGTIDDPDSLRAAVAAADGVIHTAYDHSDWSALTTTAAHKDSQVVKALGEELAGSGRPLVTTFGTTGLQPGFVLTEQFRPEAGQRAGRAVVEALVLEMATTDVRTVSVRPATVVHHQGVLGFVHFLAEVARQKGFSAYPGDGSNRWPAVHVDDAAAVYRLGLETAQPGSVLHAVGEEGITSRAIAEEIGRALGLPVQAVATEQAVEHFGWIGSLFALDIPASSHATQELLGRRLTGPSLLEDLAAGLAH